MISLRKGMMVTWKLRQKRGWERGLLFVCRLPESYLPAKDGDEKDNTDFTDYYKMAELKHKEITKKIIGAAFHVHKFLGNACPFGKGAKPCQPDRSA